MKTFTIDAENNITVFSSRKEAAAASTTPFDAFANQNEFAELTADWPMQRLMEIWNGIPGVTPVSKFTSRKIAAERIWRAIQGLGETPKQAQPEASSPELEPAVATAEEPPTTAEPPQAEEAPVAAECDAVAESPVETSPSEPLAEAGAQVPGVTPVADAPTPESAPAKKSRKASQKAKAPKAEGPREGSKTAQVVAMLQREGGATLAEIMKQMGWQKHTVRGFMAGTLKKAGYTVESFKPEGGERTYRINQ